MEKFGTAPLTRPLQMTILAAREVLLVRFMAIRDFEAHALQIPGEIAQSKKPLVEVIPFSEDKPVPGAWNTFGFEKTFSIGSSYHLKERFAYLSRIHYI